MQTAYSMQSSHNKHCQRKGFFYHHPCKVVMFIWSASYNYVLKKLPFSEMIKTRKGEAKI